MRLFPTSGSTDGGRAWLGLVAGTKEDLLDMMACPVVTWSGRTWASNVVTCNSSLLRNCTRGQSLAASGFNGVETGLDRYMDARASFHESWTGLGQLKLARKVAGK